MTRVAAQHAALVGVVGRAGGSGQLVGRVRRVAEDHEVAVGQPAQQLAGLGRWSRGRTGPGRRRSSSASVADQLVHLRCVGDRVHDVAQHAAARPSTTCSCLGRRARAELDVQPRLGDGPRPEPRRCPRRRGPRPGALAVAHHHDLRVQHALDRHASDRSELGVDASRSGRGVVGDDVERGGLAVRGRATAQQDLAGGADGRVRAMAASAARALAAAGELGRGVGQVAAQEDVGSTGCRLSRCRSGSSVRVGHDGVTSL